MTPVRHPEANVAMTKPPGWTDEQCATLHILAQSGMMSSRWRPTPDELALLMRGGVVELTIAGTSHPPVALSVVTP